MAFSTFGDTAAGLSRFATQRAAIGVCPAAGAEQLAVFLKAAGPMLGYRKRRRAPVVADRAGFANAMAAIAAPLRLARDAGVLADPWALAGLRRREVANAGVLAGLWSPTSGGKVATDFLSAFFERLRDQVARHCLTVSRWTAGT